MDGKDLVALNDLEGELDDLNLLLRRNPSVSRSFDFSKIRNASYQDFWASYYKENWYDYQLVDYSLLSFVDNGQGVTFIYLGCPYDVKLTEKEYYEEESNMLPYDDYLLTCPKLENVSYIRYDKAYNQYREGVHPACHFHFGYFQNNRVGIIHDIGICSFLAIVIRQCYPDSWKKVLSDSRKYPRLYGHKNNPKALDPKYVSGVDLNQDYYLK